MAIAAVGDRSNFVAHLQSKSFIGRMLSSVLDDLSDSINKSIQQAMEELDNSIIEAGRQAKLTIENVRSAYVDCLNQTIEAGNKEINKVLSDLDTLVQGVVNKEKNILDEMMGRSQIIVDSLPFADQKPKIAQIEPRLVAVKKTATLVAVAVKGDFPWSATKGYEPTLTIEGALCERIGNTTTRLDFLVPATVFKKENAHEFSYVLGELDIPWKNSGWFKSEKVTNVFNVWFGSLPRSPGKIQVKTAAYENKFVEVNRNSTAYHARGSSDSISTTAMFNITPREGWKLGPNPTFIIEKEPCNNYTYSLLAYPNEITVTLHLNGGKYVGDVYFHINYTEIQTQKVKVFDEKPLELLWGDSRLIEPDSEEETIDSLTFEAFDGTTTQFPNATNYDNSFLKLTANDNYLLVSATIPKEYELTPINTVHPKPLAEEDRLLEDLVKLKKEADEYKKFLEEKQKALSDTAEKLKNRVKTL